MSLRVKSLLVFSGALVLLFGMVVTLVKTVIEKQFTDIEIDKMRRYAERFHADLQKELQPVISTTADWSAWDEIYDFVEGKNPGFPEINLTQKDMATLHLDFFALWRQDRSLLVLETNAESLQQDSITPQLLTAAILETKMVPRQDSDISGLISIGDKIAFVSSSPILRSTRTGPPVGTLVGGKILGMQRLRNFEEFTDYRIDFSPPSFAHANAEGKLITEVRIFSAEKITANIPIVGVNGNVIAVANLTSSRPLHLQAEKTIRIFLIGLACSAGILLFLVWYQLDSSVILPIQRLAGKVAEAVAQRKLPSNLGFSGKDEVADLAHRIEEMARTVERTEASYRGIVEDQTDFIFRYRPDGKITFVNESLCRYFGKSREELIGSNAHAIVAKSDMKRVSHALSQLSANAPYITLDHQVTPPNGGIAWFRRTDRAFFQGDGKLRETQCVAYDITQAHLAREMLKSSETRYRCLFEAATDGILIIKQSNLVVNDANPELCRMLDSTRFNLIDRPVGDIPQFKATKTQHILSQLLDKDSTLRKNEIVLLQNDTRRYLEVTSSVYDEEEETIIQLNFRDISQRKQASDELRELSGHLLRLQDEERRRIARELHDSTAQNLTAIQMAVKKLEPFHPKDTESHPIMQEIINLANLCAREIRTISYLLHPPLLDEVGLLFALRWYVDGFMTRTETIVRLNVPDSLERLSPEIETTIFRTVQESLSNIHRHAGSKRAWIRLAVDSEAITLEVRDEGKGFTLPSPGSRRTAVIGVGIAGMRERLRQFNGSLTIESGNMGTTIRARLPLKFDEKSED